MQSSSEQNFNFMIYKTKLKIIGLLLAGSVAGGSIQVGNITKNKAEVESLYQQIKSELFVKHIKGEEMTWEEFDIFVQILDKEAKEKKFKAIKNFDKKDSIKKMIEKAI